MTQNQQAMEMTKEWLERYGAAKRQLDFYREEMQRLRMEATSITASLTGMPRGSGTADRVALSLERIARNEEKMNEQADLCLNLRMELTEAISRVNGVQVKEVLRRRYLELEEYADIADGMGVVARRVYQLRLQGVKQLTQAKLRGQEAARVGAAFQ